jgi:hypothetical protein
MGAEQAKNIILGAGSDFGLSLLAIVGACLIIGIGMLIFREGRRFLTDQSYSLGGYYLRNLPYKGYHRFRSKKWNMEHMAD